MLDLFLLKAEELRDSRFVRSGFAPHTRLTFDLDDMRGSAEFAVPDREDFRSFLVVFRQFVAKNSPIRLTNVYDFCYLAFTDDKIKTKSVESRARYNRTCEGFGTRLIHRRVGKQPDGTMVVDRETTERADEVAERWMNGVIFHPDAGEMADLTTPTIWNAFRHDHFLDFVYGTVIEISNVERLIRYARENGLIKGVQE